MHRREYLVYMLAAGLGLTAGGFCVRWAAAMSAAAPQTPYVKAKSTRPLHPAQGEWEAMTEKMAKLALDHKGRVAIYLKDLRGGREWTYHADDLFPSASLIKIPIMACVFKKMQEGSLTLNQRLTLRRRDRVGGSGRMKWAPDGAAFTVREVLDRMITESDNTATKMLLDEIGFDYFVKEFPNLGLTYTQIHAEGFSLENKRIANENYTTAREMASLLDRMYEGKLVDKFSSEMMLEYMKGLKTRKRLARPLPVGWQLAHKTGLLRGACHDVGIVMSPQGDYVLAVLTGQNANYKVAKSFIEKLAGTTYKYLKADTELAKVSGSTAALR